MIFELFLCLYNRHSSYRAAILQSAVTMLPAAAALWLYSSAAELPVIPQISH